MAENDSVSPIVEWSLFELFYTRAFNQAIVISCPSTDLQPQTQSIGRFENRKRKKIPFDAMIRRWIRSGKSNASLFIVDDDDSGEGCDWTYRCRQSIRIVALQFQGSANLPSGRRWGTQVILVVWRLSSDVHRSHIFVDDLTLVRHKFEAARWRYEAYGGDICGERDSIRDDSTTSNQQIQNCDIRLERNSSTSAEVAVKSQK